MHQSKIQTNEISHRSSRPIYNTTLNTTMIQSSLQLTKPTAPLTTTTTKIIANDHGHVVAVDYNCNNNNDCDDCYWRRHRLKPPPIGTTNYHHHHRSHLVVAVVVKSCYISAGCHYDKANSRSHHIYILTKVPPFDNLAAIFNYVNANHNILSGLSMSDRQLSNRMLHDSLAQCELFTIVTNHDNQYLRIGQYDNQQTDALSFHIDSLKSKIDNQTRTNSKHARLVNELQVDQSNRPMILKWDHCASFERQEHKKFHEISSSPLSLEKASDAETHQCNGGNSLSNTNDSQNLSQSNYHNNDESHRYRQQNNRKDHTISTMLFHVTNAKFTSRTSFMANNLLVLYLALFITVLNDLLPLTPRNIQSQRTVRLTSSQIVGAKPIYLGLPRLLSVHSSHITNTSDIEADLSSNLLPVEEEQRLTSSSSPLFDSQRLPASVSLKRELNETASFSSSSSSRSSIDDSELSRIPLVDKTIAPKEIIVDNHYHRNLLHGSQSNGPTVPGRQRQDDGIGAIINLQTSADGGGSTQEESNSIKQHDGLTVGPNKQKISQPASPGHNQNNNNNNDGKPVDSFLKLKHTIFQTYDLNLDQHNGDDIGERLSNHAHTEVRSRPRPQTVSSPSSSSFVARSSDSKIGTTTNTETTNTNNKKRHHRRDTSDQQQQQSASSSSHHRSHTHARAASSTYSNRPLVQTNKGLVRGFIQQIVTGKNVEVFLGVPYAKPPIGRYRFRHPQPIDPWQGELDASKFANSCYQVNDTFFGQTFRGTSMWNANTPLDEDCLHLNIWAPMGSSVRYTSRSSDASNNDDNLTPSSSIMSDLGSYTNGGTINDGGDSGGFYRRGSYQGARSTSSSSSSIGVDAREPDSKRLRPVLVWIFGGGFYYGTSSLSIYDGGILASEEDILVVSMNYRVAAFGFLYFGRPDAPGNSGLFDQLMALQWINDNIEQFGGDPNRITIFGESSGAVSVAYHLLSPLSRNLFNQAILQSGAATCPWGIKDTKEMISLGLELAKALNCPADINDLDSVIECLIRADPMVLVKQGVGHPKNVVDFPFVPVVDGSFLLEQPAESLAKSNFKKTRLLLGSNSDEGNFFLIYHIDEFNKCSTANMSPATGSSSSLTMMNNNMNLNNMNSADFNEPRRNNNNNNNREQDDDINDDQFIAGASNKQVKQHASYDTTMTNPSSSATISPSQLPPSQVSDAGLVDGGPVCRPPDHLSMERKDFLRLVKGDLNPYAYQNLGKEAIIFEYTNWNNPNDSISNYDAMDKIVGDYFFTCHVNEFAYRYALTRNSVYMYYFRHRSTVSPWPEWMGVLHADEINFIFGEPLNPAYGYSHQEVQLSRRMMNYWANFAKYGNPTRINETSLSSEQWPQYSNNREYLELQVGSPRIGHGPRNKKCAFWQHYLPRLLNSSSHAEGCSSQQQDFGKNRSLLGSSKQPIIVAITGIIVIVSIILLLVLAKRVWKPDLNVTPGD